MQFIRNEFNLLMTALGFFTRIPCAAYHFSQESMNRCNRYFPAIGLLVGSVGAFTYWISSLLLPVNVSVFLSMIATILTTGAFHEDGFADVCDGFGGGWTKERIMEIMKDSRMGAYGVIGLILILGLKFLLLSSLPQELIIVSILVAHTISRSMATLTMFSLRYVREDETSKAKPIAKNTHASDVIIACITGLATFFLMPSWWYLLILAPMFLIKTLTDRWFFKWIGGYTGDCLGTIQQITEIIAYLSILIVASCGI